MTRDDAIWILKHIEAHGIAKEAKDMAIHALEFPVMHEAQIIEDGYHGLPSVCSYCEVSVLRSHDYCWHCGAKFIKENKT